MKTELYRLLETVQSEDGIKQFSIERKILKKKRFLWWIWFEWTNWEHQIFSTDKEFIESMYETLIADQPFRCEMMPTFLRSVEREKYRAEQRAEKRAQREKGE